MDIQTVFWEMIREVGSSSEEINELGAGISFMSGTKVSIWTTKVAEEESVHDKLIHQKNVTVFFNFKEIDLYDPDSLEILNEFIVQARSKKESNDRALAIIDHGLTISDSIMMKWEGKDFIADLRLPLPE